MTDLTISAARFFDDGAHGCRDIKIPNPSIGSALYRSTER